MKLDKYKLITASLVGITACSGFVITAVHADTPASGSSSANASITVSNTINLTLTSGDLVIDNLTPGNASDSNIITATITSNSPYGYHLSATTGTSTGTTSLVNTADSNFSFTNLSANKATLNDFSDNTWGYSYSTDNGTTWISGDYGSALAGYNGLTLDNDDSGATGTTLFNNDSYAGSTAVKFKIGAKSATTQAAGTYTGTVNFYAVTNPKPIITFDMAYADAGKEKLNGYYKMQDATPSICSAVDEDQVGQVIDTRDNQVYKIGKLKDGKCWLLDNLALDLVTHKNDLSSTNTNASDEMLAYLKNGGGADANQYANAGVAYWTSSYSYTAPLIAIKNASNTDWNPNTVPSDATSQSGQYKVGVYYNYCAASAGSYCYDTSSSAPSDQQNGVRSIDADICPKGWRMPTGNTSGEYSALANAIYGSTMDTDDPTALVNYRNALRLPLSGYFYYGSAYDQGSYGYFWSSTRINNVFMRILRLNTSNVDPAHGNSRDYGNSVRCVLGS